MTTNVVLEPLVAVEGTIDPHKINKQHEHKAWKRNYIAPDEEKCLGRLCIEVFGDNARVNVATSQVAQNIWKITFYYSQGKSTTVYEAVVRMTRVTVIREKPQ